MLKVSILMIQTTTDTGQAEVTGSNPVEALIFFFQASSFQLFKIIGKFTAMIILHFQIQASFKLMCLCCALQVFIPEWPVAEGWEDRMCNHLRKVSSLFNKP